MKMMMMKMMMKTKMKVKVKGVTVRQVQELILASFQLNTRTML
jgi:hypothetical protein